MKTSSGFGVLVLAASLMLAAAAEAKLTIGDPAPQLQPGKWIQGDAVPAFDTNHVYIVEFWATWCGPCRASIPHLNGLYEKFKDQGIIAIGQDVWEQNEDGVAPFVKKMGANMTYRVALDDKSQNTKGAMATTWMDAADQHGIPTAFIVNRHGVIAWIGHPMGLTEAVLGQILADKFDTGSFAKKYEKDQLAATLRNALYHKLRTAMKTNDWDAADAALAEVEKAEPENARYQFGTTHLQILLGRKDYDGAYKLAESLSDAQRNNTVFQNELAWTLVTSKDLNQRGLVVAKKIAERANTAAKEKEPQILDTLARAQFMNGMTNEAVATEQKAVDLAPAEMKDYLNKFLTNYQQGKLPEMSE
jgi:thiol-disulfide isomerase/thioredoxin